MTPDVDAPPARRGRGPPIHSAALPCEVCGEETAHRILHLEPGASARRVRGVARCQVCRTTRPFDVAGGEEVPVRVVLSDGPRSEPRELRVEPGIPLRVGDPLPALEPPARIQRLELDGGRSAEEADPRRVRTIWAAVDRGPSLAVSLIEGSRTRSLVVPTDPEAPVTVGGPIALGELVAVVSAFRARHRTWSRPGDRFPAREVERVYARRNETPPGGSRRWTSSREIPSSPTRFRSTSGRSRSSPGVRTPRRRPPRANDSRGAAHHSSVPS